MGYQPRLVHCRLKTGGKSIGQIRERFHGQGLTYRELESLREMYNQFEGREVVLSLWDYDNMESYHFDSWKPDDDDAVMRGIYFAEQTHPFRQCYKNNFKRFEEDWKNHEYDFDGASLVFSAEDVEELDEVIMEKKT